MRSTILVIAMAAVSSVATAGQQGPQFTDSFSEDTLPYASLLAPENPDLFTRTADTVNEMPAIAFEDAVLSLLIAGFLFVAGHRRIRHLRRAGRRRVRTERRLMA